MKKEFRETPDIISRTDEWSACIIEMLSCIIELLEKEEKIKDDVKEEVAVPEVKAKPKTTTKKTASKKNEKK